MEEHAQWPIAGDANAYHNCLKRLTKIRWKYFIIEKWNQQKPRTSNVRNH